MSAHYYKDGILVPEGTEGALPSVTTILAVRANPGLDAWRERVGAEEAHKRQQESSELGTKVHESVEYYLNTGSNVLWMGDTPFDFMGRGFLAWVDKYRPTLTKPEVFLQSDLHEYCGTADLICEIEGEQWLIDFKTSSHIRPEYALQLAAYEQAWAEMGSGRSRRAVLQLTTQIKRGWRFKEFDHEDDLPVFLAHKEIHDWQQRVTPPAKEYAGPVWAFKEEAQ